MKIVLLIPLPIKKINADQCRSNCINTSQDQCLSLLINAGSSSIDLTLRRFEWHWSLLRAVFWINSRIWIGIDRYWSASGIDRGVLINIRSEQLLNYCTISQASPGLFTAILCIWLECKLNVCFLLKHNIGDCIVHLNGCEHIIIGPDISYTAGWKMCTGEKKQNKEQQQQQQEKISVIMRME